MMKHIIFNTTLATRTTFKDHLEHRGQTGRYLLEEVPVNIPIEQRQYFDLTARAATRELRSDLTWALCLANAEHIKELVIPIMDITCYVALVPRLKVLSNVTFLFDKGFQVTTRYGPTYTPAEQEQLESQKSKRILAFEEMVSFVQEHRRVLPHVLKLGRGYRDPYASNDDCPEENQFRLLQALPPLISPSVLDQQNWPQFVAKAHETDLSLVKTIQPCSFFAPRAPPKPSGPFFHRCRVLESVIVPFLDIDTFQWVVDERKQHDAILVDVAFIPPAEELDGADDESIDDNNKDADSPPTHESVPRKRPTWTWDWHLPNLVSLTLNAEVGYRFKLRMLAGTPNLVRSIVGIGSQFGQHRRTVGIADLLQPGYQHPATDRFQNQEQQRQRMIFERHVVGDIDNSGSPIELEENDDKFWKDFE
ncbi:hypothetical protein BGZ91_000345 [Linnemannia elongata]|nr:hypothetical protein BGZ91_000345 [Linnemannia elongata]